MTNPLMRDLNTVADTMGRWIMEAGSSRGSMGALGEWIAGQVRESVKMLEGY